tara:strand:- start:454 stop:591 length:138 start_codon:yes stop_codon:yes gene_type:complete
MLVKNTFIGGKPKRTSIGDGRRKGSGNGRTKRSPRRKPYRGQGRG